EARARDRAPPPRGDRRVDRADRVRRVLGAASLEAPVPELLYSGLLRLRDESTDAEDLRQRRAGAARGRLPLLRPERDAPRVRRVLSAALVGGLGSLVILFVVFGTLPAVLMPIVVAIAAILNTFTLVWALTYLTNVSIIVQFLIALVGLGVAIDYALLMIFRFRDELREGEDVETALVETMTHAGRSVIVSGSTVAVGLLSMVILPLPFIRSIGIGGML